MRKEVKFAISDFYAI